MLKILSSIKRDYYSFQQNKLASKANRCYNLDWLKIHALLAAGPLVRVEEVTVNGN
jgi:hypothetical protein